MPAERSAEGFCCDLMEKKRQVSVAATTTSCDRTKSRSSDVRREQRRVFGAATMNEVGNHPLERGAFWWEREEVDDGWVWR